MGTYVPVMAHPVDQVHAVLRLLDEGATLRATSEATGVPAATIRNWKRGRLPNRVRLEIAGVPICATCGDPEHVAADLSPHAYAYLLGLYLGDGCLSRQTRSTSLRIAMDRAYPGIVAACRAAIESVRGKRPCLVYEKDSGCVVVISYWKRWPCLFPQHGPGKKHHRPIVLTGWQRAVVAAEPEALIRGLIHSDGWRGLNRVTVKGRDYAYPRYQFSSRSEDIRRIFTDACDAIGVRWRPWGRWHISVARKDSVAKLDTFIGRKC